MVPEGGFIRLFSQVLLLLGTLYNASQRMDTQHEEEGIMPTPKGSSQGSAGDIA